MEKRKEMKTFSTDELPAIIANVAPLPAEITKLKIGGWFDKKSHNMVFGLIAVREKDDYNLSYQGRPLFFSQEADAKKLRKELLKTRKP